MTSSVLKPCFERSRANAQLKRPFLNEAIGVTASHEQNLQPRAARPRAIAGKYESVHVSLRSYRNCSSGPSVRLVGPFPLNP